MKDYSKLSDKELNDIIDPSINKGGIPFAAVQEHQKRNRNQYTSNDNINSHDFDENGKYIGK